MSVTVEVSHRPGPGPGATVVRIGGSLEADTAPKAAQQIEPIVAAAPKVVVLDLGELTFMSSSGISLVLDLQKRLGARGSRVFVTNMQPQISKVMDIVRALPGSAIFQDLAEMDEYLAAIQRRVTEEGEGSA